MSRLRKFVRLVRRDGIKVATRRALLKRLNQGVAASPTAKWDTIGSVELLLGEARGFGIKLTPENVPMRSMTWVMPDFTASSGGHINILRMMRLLMDRGFKSQHIVIMEPHRWSTVDQARAALEEAFGKSEITVSLGVRSIEPCHYLVATGWQTAYWVAKYRDAIHRLYFVQDFEPDFYANGSEHILAENTYKLGLTGITAGAWLAEKLSAEYGMATFPFSFACDLSFYRPHPKRAHARRQVFFYARPVTPRRCFEMGLVALKRICEQVPDVEVIFAGWDVGGHKIPFPHLNKGVVPLAELPDLYSQCDVALILSATNLSLLPLEVAACGCPLVINKGPNSGWLLSDQEAFYCEMTVEGITETVMRVLNDPARAARVASAALRRAKASDWGLETDRIVSFLSAMDNAGLSAHKLAVADQ